MPNDAQANDLVLWETCLVVDDLVTFPTRPQAGDTRFVSRPRAANGHIIRDPDGHALRLVNPRSDRVREALTSTSKEY